MSQLDVKAKIVWKRFKSSDLGCMSFGIVLTILIIFALYLIHQIIVFLIISETLSPLKCDKPCTVNVQAIIYMLLITAFLFLTSIAGFLLHLTITETAESMRKGQAFFNTNAGQFLLFLGIALIFILVGVVISALNFRYLLTTGQFSDRVLFSGLLTICESAILLCIYGGFVICANSCKECCKAVRDDLKTLESKNVL